MCSREMRKKKRVQKMGQLKSEYASNVPLNYCEMRIITIRLFIHKIPYIVHIAIVFGVFDLENFRFWFESTYMCVEIV